MKKDMKNRLLLSFALLSVFAVNVYGQTKYESFKSIIPIIADSVNYNKHLIATLALNDEESKLVLQLRNASSDTIRIISRVKVESTSVLNFMLVCISDSCVRDKTQSFNFDDEYKYSYTHEFWKNYNISTGEFNCGYIKLLDDKIVLIEPHSVFYSTLNFIPRCNKYTFVKLQLKYAMSNVWYTTQQETNCVMW